MLVELRVENLGIISELMLTLDGGMTVITGETGAGKTLIVDALELVCGGRAVIRARADYDALTRIARSFSANVDDTPGLVQALLTRAEDLDKARRKLAVELSSARGHALYKETIEQCVLADRVGFDNIWFVEHHFLTGFSGSPCPEVLLGALSQLTRGIRIGFGVSILPAHHPIHVAERAAMLAQLTDGRLEVGTGRSNAYEQLGQGIDHVSWGDAD